MVVRNENGGFFGETRARGETREIVAVLRRHERRLGGATPVHAHTLPYLALVARGTFRERTHAGEHSRSPGSLALDTAGVEHSDQIDSEVCEVIVFELPETWLAPLRDEGTLAERAFAWTTRKGLIERARSLRAHLERPEPLSSLVIEGAAAELLLLAAGGPGSRRRGRAPAWLGEVEEAVRARFRRPPPLAELAALAGRSPSQVVRAFRQWHGLSLGALARRLRAEHARRALLESDAPLADIAREAGYSDQSHMTRELGTYAGCTPARLRRTSGRPGAT